MRLNNRFENLDHFSRCDNERFPGKVLYVSCNQVGVLFAHLDLIENNVLGVVGDFDISAETRTLVSMTANSLLSISRCRYFRVDILQAHVPRTGSQRHLSHFLKSLPAFLPGFDLRIGLDLERNPALADDSLHEQVEGRAVAESELVAKDVEVPLQLFVYSDCYRCHTQIVFVCNANIMQN